MSSELTVRNSLASWREPSGCLLEGCRLDSEWHHRPRASRGGFPAPTWCSCKGGFSCWTRLPPAAHSLLREHWMCQESNFITFGCVVIWPLSTEWSLGPVCIPPKERDMASMFLSKKPMEFPRHLFVHVESWTRVTVVIFLPKMQENWIFGSRQMCRLFYI